MNTKQMADMAHWFEAQSEVSTHTLPERLMLENVSRWLRRQQSSAAPSAPKADPWIGMSV